MQPAKKLKTGTVNLLRHEMHKLCELSTADDSGWREVDQDRVAELEVMIFEGNWGATALAGPSLVAEGDKVGRQVHTVLEDIRVFA